jgi:hypothetical protein
MIRVHSILTENQCCFFISSTIYHFLLDCLPNLVASDFCDYKSHTAEETNIPLYTIAREKRHACITQSLYHSPWSKLFEHLLSHSHTIRRSLYGEWNAIWNVKLMSGMSNACICSSSIRPMTCVYLHQVYVQWHAYLHQVYGACSLFIVSCGAH